MKVSGLELTRALILLDPVFPADRRLRLRRPPCAGPPARLSRSPWLARRSTRVSGINPNERPCEAAHAPWTGAHQPGRSTSQTSPQPAPGAHDSGGPCQGLILPTAVAIEVEALVAVTPLVYTIRYYLRRVASRSLVSPPVTGLVVVRPESGVSE
jgi:hypothetical protein